jgi:hypothetical protein
MSIPSFVREIVIGFLVALCGLAIIIIPILIVTSSPSKKAPVAEADNRHKVLVYHGGQEVRRFTSEGDIQFESIKVKFRDSLNGEEVSLIELAGHLVIIEKF